MHTPLPTTPLWEVHSKKIISEVLKGTCKSHVSPMNSYKRHKGTLDSTVYKKKKTANLKVYQSGTSLWHT